MENYKIKRNPKPISEEQVKRHQDFDKLIADHHKLHRYKDATKPLYKNSKFMGFMVLVGIVLLVLFLSTIEDEKDTNTSVTVPIVKSDTGFQRTIPVAKEVMPKISNDVKTDKKEEVNSELTKVYESFIIQPEKGAILYLTSGQRILVPVNAFHDKEDRISKNEILLKVRSIKSFLELNVKAVPNFTANSIFELKAEEINGGSEVRLARPIIMELAMEVSQKNGKTYHYENENWKLNSDEKISYRFLVHANESEYPSFISFKNCVWEFTEQTREVTDFNYVFNRPWEKINFFDSDNRGMLLINTNSSFKARADIVPLVGDQAENLKLRNAFFALYNQKVIDDADKKKEAFALLEKWKNSEEGQQYSNWLSKFSNSEQFYSDKKTSTFTLSSLGYFVFSFDSKKKNALQMTKRVLVLSKKKQDRNQLFSDELIKNEPTLKR